MMATKFFFLFLMFGFIFAGVNAQPPLDPTPGKDEKPASTELGLLDQATDAEQSSKQTTSKTIPSDYMDGAAKVDTKIASEYRLNPELLKKEPLKKDFTKVLSGLSHGSLQSLSALAIGLEVEVVLKPNAGVENLALVYDAWIRLNNDVTWGKLLAVCDDYPNELGNAKAKLTDFLLTKKAHENYLQETLENPYGRKKKVCPVSVQNLEPSQTKSVYSHVAHKGIPTSISKKPTHHKTKNERQDKKSPDYYYKEPSSMEEACPDYKEPKPKKFGLLDIIVRAFIIFIVVWFFFKNYNIH